MGIGLTIALLIATRLYLSVTLGESNQYDNFVNMEFSKELKMRATKSVDKLYASDPSGRPDNQIRAIKKRGILRIGFLADCLPFAFKNDEGQALGYDIEMGYLLAKELKVKPEFYKVTKKQLKGLLDSGRLDIVMSGMAITTSRLEKYSFANK